MMRKASMSFPQEKEKEATNFTCEWALNTSANDSPSSFYTLDLIITPNRLESKDLLNASASQNEGLLLSDAQGQTIGELVENTSSPATVFLFDELRKRLNTAALENQPALLKFLFPMIDGYFIRRNYFEARMALCQTVESVSSFLKQGQEVNAVIHAHDLSPDLPTLLSYLVPMSCCALTVAFSAELSAQESMKQIEKELYLRLSSPWVVPSPIQRHVLAILKGPSKKELATTMLDSARNLDIELVILDSPGHWLELPENSSYRKHFLPIDMTIDAGLGMRAATALKDAGLNDVVEAVISFRDSCLEAAAEAMDVLGLSTDQAPASAFQIANDKYLTRMLNQDVSCCFRFSGLNDLEDKLLSEPIVFPLVVKPCHGVASEGVSKVHNPQELYACVQEWLDMEKESFRHGTEMMVERYVDGPEVDANFVLFDGEILFFEVVDDYPCAADAQSATFSDTFVEGGMFYPSALPPEEYELLKTSLYESLLKIGFRTGVFHCEARIKNSSMTYVRTASDIEESYELTTVSSECQPLATVKSKPKPSVFLIEVNARPVDLMGVIPVMHAYGVSYYDQFFLCALKDRERAIALSQPFRGAPLLWTELVFIKATKGGVLASDEPCEELLSRCPELKGNITYYSNLRKKGDVLFDPSRKREVLHPWIAVLAASSRKSRSEAIAIAQKVRKEFKYHLV